MITDKVSFLRPLGWWSILCCLYHLAYKTTSSKGIKFSDEEMKTHNDVEQYGQTVRPQSPLPLVVICDLSRVQKHARLCDHCGVKKIFLNLLLFCCIFCFDICCIYANGNESFENFLSQGITAFKNGETKKAAECFAECVKINPHSYLPHYWAAMLHGNRLELAEEAIDYAIKLAPHEPDPHALRGYIKFSKGIGTLDTLQGIRYIVQGLDDIDVALIIEPDNVVANYYKAAALTRLNQLNDAVLYFQSVLTNTSDKEEFFAKRHPQNYRYLACYYLAEVYIRLQSFDKALESIDMALAIALQSDMNPTQKANCYRLRYQANYQINKENAVRDLEKIIEYKPSSLKTLTYQKIILLLEMNSIEKATDLCRAMLQSLPPDDLTRVIYIFCLAFKCHQIEEATKNIDDFDEKKFRENYQRGLVSKDDLRFFYETRCFLNIARNRLADAHKDISSKIDLAPDNNSREYLIRTIILFLMDKKEEALADFDPNLPLLYLFRSFE